jgi:hypothetical protein
MDGGMGGREPAGGGVHDIQYKNWFITVDLQNAGRFEFF